MHGVSTLWRGLVLKYTKDIYLLQEPEKKRHPDITVTFLKMF